MVDPVARFNSIVQKIKENNQRLTPQRLAIVKILTHNSEGHPSVEKIYQQYARLFHPRPLQISGLHPHSEAASENQSALCFCGVGLLVAVAGVPAPGDDFDVGSWVADRRTPHQWLGQSYLQFHQRSE